MQNQFLPSKTSSQTDSPAFTPPDITATTTVISTDTAQTEAQEILPVQSTSGLMTRERSKLRRRKKKHLATLLLLEACCAITFVAALAGLHVLQTDTAAMFRLYALAFLTLALAVVPMIWVMLKPVDVNIEELAQSRDVNAIPTLIDSMNLGITKKHRQRVTRALTLLLPLLKTSDARLLTPLRRHTLNVTLGGCFQPHLRGVDEDLTLAILKAYEQVGDEKAIQVVERIANHRPRNESERRIQEAAKECLPLLCANIGEVASTQTLLRASDGQTTTSPAMLLRPAASASTTSPAELLRVPQNDDLPST